MYDYDSNYILTEAMKNRERKSIINAYETIYNILATKGLKPRFQKLNKEAYSILIQSIQDKKIDFKLVSPNMYWSNTAERAIQTFKKNFIAILCSVNPKPPLKL